MEFPGELRYTTEDEWLRIEGDEATLGITDYAQDQLGDVVFVELPEVGQTFKKGEAFGVVESVKAVSDLYMPVGGEILATNDQLAESPELVNDSPYGDGWMLRVRMSDPSEADELLSADDYRARLPEE